MTQLIIAFRNFANAPKSNRNFPTGSAVLCCKCGNIEVLTVVKGRTFKCSEMFCCVS
jgi:hypothetical protein